MTDKDFNKARHDYGFHHGFNSRGIAPAYIGGDSLPQAISDLHWAIHGIQSNIDEMDAKFDSSKETIAEETNKHLKENLEKISEAITASKTVLTNDTSYVSRVATNRTRIFSDSFGPETAMSPLQRISGYTQDYHWIQYPRLNNTCEGEYDKIIDFTYVSSNNISDGVDGKYVSKGQIVLDKCGLINRMFITQHESNIVIYYLLTQSVPTQVGVAYTGAIRRVEYDRNGELVKEGFITTNHTPLVMLGAFNCDSNNDSEFIQYISTDYKVFQHFNGMDYEIGALPNDIATMIDPVNDLISDSKQAFIMRYDAKGKLKFPLEGFTLLPTLSGKKIYEQFEKIEFNPDGELFNNIVSISPRTQTTLTQVDSKDEHMVVEGGYFIEVYDENTEDINVSSSHVFLLSSTEEVFNLDRFASNMFSYRSDAPSDFGLKRERDYTEFGEITFKHGCHKLFPEVCDDFGIPDTTAFTVEFDHGRQTETVTFWLEEPFVLTRKIHNKSVDNRLGFTVLQNSDNVRDIADTDILVNYKGLNFTNAVPLTRNYLSKLDHYTNTYKLPTKANYHVIVPANNNGDGVIEVTYFDETNLIKVTYDAKSKHPTGVTNFNEATNLVRPFEDNKVSPITTATHLEDIHNVEKLYIADNTKYVDKPYGIPTSGTTLENKTTNGRLIQSIIVASSDASVNNANSELVTFTRSISSAGSFEWSGTGTIPTPKYLHIPGYYEIATGYTAQQLGSAQPNHPVFSNVIATHAQVEVVNSEYTHIVYTLTNRDGLSMQYHNLAQRQSAEAHVPATAKSYTLKFSTWIPGKYIGNDTNPFGPDNDSVTKEILKRLAALGAQDLTVADTNSIDLTLSGSWDTTPVYNPSTGEWTASKVYKTIKADTKISSHTGSTTVDVTTSDGKTTETVSLPNAISVKNDGLYAPDYAGAINKISGSNNVASERIHELETKLVEVQGALQKIVNNLYQAGNSTSNNINTFEINNHIACGNINLYGGKADGNTLIKTHNGSAENDVTIGAR